MLKNSGKGDFLEQSFNLLHENDIVILGRVGERAAEKHKPIGSNVENFIRGANCTVLTIGENFKVPTRFILLMNILRHVKNDAPYCTK